MGRPRLCMVDTMGVSTGCGHRQQRRTPDLASLLEMDRVKCTSPACAQPTQNVKGVKCGMNSDSAILQRPGHGEVLAALCLTDLLLRDPSMRSATNLDSNAIALISGSLVWTK